MERAWIPASAGMTNSKKVIILGVEVADAGRQEALDLVQREVKYKGPLAPLRQGYGGLEATVNYITTPNPEIVLAARKDKELRSIINNSFLALPDGFGLKIAARILGQKLENRIAGADFMLALCPLAEKEGWPVFLLGGQTLTPPSPLKGEGTAIAEQAAEKLRRLYPQIKIVGSMSGGEIREEAGKWVASDGSVIDKINESGAKILFVGFGCPKQEKWLRDNLKKLTTVRMAMTVGGTFDYLAGRVRRAPLALRRFGLEWLWRLFHEPRRAGRIWNATARFMWEVIKWRLRMQFSYRRNVVGFIVNNDEQVLVVRRRPGTLIQGDDENHWQLPQGGVDKGESGQEAIRREMSEEVGLRQLEILGTHPQKHNYEVPLLVQLHYGRRGQKQTIFYLRWPGAKDAVRLDQDELVDYRWVAVNELVESVHELRRPVTKMAVEGFTMSFLRKQESSP